MSGLKHLPFLDSVTDYLLLFRLHNQFLFCFFMGFPGGSVVKDMPANAGDSGLILGSERSPGEGNGNPLQYFCLVNPMDRGAWWATTHRVANSWTWLGTHTHLIHISLIFMARRQTWAPPFAHSGSPTEMGKASTQREHRTEPEKEQQVFKNSSSTLTDIQKSTQIKYSSPAYHKAIPA